MPSAACATSASSKTTTGAFPPSSRWTRLSPAAAAWATWMPARTDPVIDTICGMSWLTSARPVPALPQITLSTPGGRYRGRDLGQHQRGDRGGVRGLEHDGVAGGQGRRDLPDRHHQRVVPGRHLGADADRLAPDHRGVPGHVLARRAALQDARGAGEEPELVHARRELLGQGQGDRLPGVPALGLHQVGGPLLDRIGDLQQGEAALRRGRVAPGLPGRLRAAQGGVHVLRAGHGRERVGLPGAGVHHLAGAARRGGHVLAVHEVLQVRHAGAGLHGRCQGPPPQGECPGHGAGALDASSCRLAPTLAEKSFANK